MEKKKTGNNLNKRKLSVIGELRNTSLGLDLL
jgi:hypothetical protein